MALVMVILLFRVASQMPVKAGSTVRVQRLRSEELGVEGTARVLPESCLSPPNRGSSQGRQQATAVRR